MNNFEINKYGDKSWHQNGLLHREDGPALEFASGNKSWYKNGKLHRKDGPAVEYVSGNKSWWINNIYIYKHIVKNNILDKIYAETFNKTFIRINKKDIINLRETFNLIDIEEILNE